jgi:hypothetical protein
MDGGHGAITQKNNTKSLFFFFLFVTQKNKIKNKIELMMSSK